MLRAFVYAFLSLSLFAPAAQAQDKSIESDKEIAWQSGNQLIVLSDNVVTSYLNGKKIHREAHVRYDCSGNTADNWIKSADNRNKNKLENTPDKYNFDNNFIIISCGWNAISIDLIYDIKTLKFYGRIDGSDFDVIRDETGNTKFIAAEGGENGEPQFAFSGSGIVFDELVPHVIYKVSQDKLVIDTQNMRKSKIYIIQKFCSSLPDGFYPTSDKLLQACRDDKPIPAFTQIITESRSPSYQGIAEDGTAEMEGLMMQLVYGGQESAAWDIMNKSWPDAVPGKQEFEQSFLNDLACYGHLQVLQTLNPSSKILKTIQCKKYW